MYYNHGDHMYGNVSTNPGSLNMLVVGYLARLKVWQRKEGKLGVNLLFHFLWLMQQLLQWWECSFPVVLVKEGSMFICSS